MQSDINNTNHPDAFSESIREKLQNHSLPVDPNGWSELQTRMNATKTKRIIPFWYWFSGGAAVAVFALLFTLTPLSEQTNFTSKINTSKQATPLKVLSSHNTKTEVEITNAKKDAFSEKLLKNSKSAKILEKKIDTSKGDSTKGQLSTKPLNKDNIVAKTKTTLENNASITQTEALDVDNTIATLQKTQTVVIDDSISNANNGVLAGTINFETETSKNDKPTLKEKVLPNSLLIEPINDEPKAKIKAKNEFLLAAAFGSGERASVSGGEFDYISADVGKRQLTKAVTNYTRIMAPNDFEEQTFMAPLSFGLIARKNIGSKLGLETGLVYTYLLSTFVEKRNSQTDAQLSLHYLGIPLNIIIPIWKNTKCEVYWSGGGMLEKGLRSIYIQNEHFGTQTITTDARTKIDGLQWSVNTAMGVTYKIQRNISIYFEPKFSYFFENKQPVSARTDQPVVIGLTGGLRYKF